MEKFKWSGGEVTSTLMHQTSSKLVFLFLTVVPSPRLCCFCEMWASFFSLSGDIQIGMVDKKGQLEVEVIRARGLTQKPGSKSTPGKETKAI